MKILFALFLTAIAFTATAQDIKLRLPSGNQATVKQYTIEAQTSEDNVNLVYQEVRRILKLAKPKGFRIYDIYIVTPQGTYYANYSMQKKISRI
jgi:hypothetical protein